MSDNEADGGSVHDSDNEISKLQEDSESEYHSEDNPIDDDDSEHEANSTHSGSSRTSTRYSKAGFVEKPKAKRLVQSQIVKPPRATYSDAYRDFYNDHVEELAHPFLSKTHGLPASEIGVAVWTPREKEILFHKVSTLGKNNIRAISEAIKTKSEPEVRQYLTLLDQGTVEGNVTLALPVFSAADVSAAIEVSKQSENLLEEFADGLSKYQLKSDQKREKKRHGDYWLLTDDIAEEIEEEVMARDGSYMKSKLYDEEDDEDLELMRHEQDVSEKDSEELKARQDLSETGTKDEQSNPREGASQNGESDQESAEPAGELMVPAAELLDLPMWLRLSPLLMHQPSESGDNWTDFVTSRHETPSMYHTAFQDFHSLTISLTRRLVQATIFQTMTRLRARDRDQPSTAVTANDVRTTAEILDLTPNMRKFWAGVPRRHGLRVYERGSKFAKGQSRAGVELSLEEAEQRMGVGQISTVNTEANDDAIDTIEDEAEDGVLDPDRYYEDPELWTEVPESEEDAPIDIPDDQRSTASGDEAAYDPADSDEAQAAARKKRRQKGRMEQNFEKAHDTYLEAMDQEISRLQEVEMWDTLGMPPPKEIKDEEIEIPRQPVIKRRLSDTADWRDGIEYQPPWERDLNAVPSEKFVQMHKRGEQAKKRRRLAYDYLEQQGLITLPPQTPEPTVVKKKVPPTDNDVEMEDAPTEEMVVPTTQTFDDGVPRKKHPNPILSRVQSRASSIRESSHDSSRSASANPRGSALADRLFNRQRAPTQQIKSDAKRAEGQGKPGAEKQQAEERAKEEEQKAKELAKEEKRKARAARKEMTEEEKQAVTREKNEERKRNKKLQRQQERKQRDEEEKQRIKEEKQKMKEEKKRAREAKRMSVSGEVPVGTEDSATSEEGQELSGSLEDTVQEDHNQEARTEEDEQDNIRQEDQAGQPKEQTRPTRLRSKKSKRQSGF